jgi:Matrixin
VSAARRRSPQSSALRARCAVASFALLAMGAGQGTGGRFHSIAARVAPECGGVFDRSGVSPEWRHNQEGRRWPPGAPLTWSLEGISATLGEEQAREALRRVFDKWAAASHLQFEELRGGVGAIRIAFVRGRHDAAWPGDDRAFDDSGEVAAHSFYPPDGIVHFNDSVRWGPVEDGDRHDFETFALHEVGHALGLDHAATGGAIMRARPHEGQHELSDDDRAGIAALYSR